MVSNRNLLFQGAPIFRGKLFVSGKLPPVVQESCKAFFPAFLLRNKRNYHFAVFGSDASMKQLPPTSNKSKVEMICTMFECRYLIMLNWHLHVPNLGHVCINIYIYILSMINIYNNQLSPKIRRSW